MIKFPSSPPFQWGTKPRVPKRIKFSPNSSKLPGFWRELGFYNNTSNQSRAIPRFYLLGEMHRILMMAPGNRTLFLKGRIARRLGSSTGSAIREREEREKRGGITIYKMRRVGVINRREGRGWVTPSSVRACGNARSASGDDVDAPSAPKISI